MTEGYRLPHSLTLDQCQKLTVTGVTEVLRFDENAVVLRTEPGLLLVQGRELKLKQLTPDEGNVCVEGCIDVLSYQEPRRGGWLDRLRK